MAFVNELISEEDKKKIDWTKFKWWERADPHRPWKWTIDRSANVFLVRLTGEGRENQHPEYFALCWKGHVVRFSATRQGGGPPGTKPDMSWRIFEIELPSELESLRASIISSLREAIDAYGYLYDREDVGSVLIVVECRN